ncbi:DMT family transporter [Paludibacterium purpuratum]|uniref:Drug/metabolite transporter (DMT)-like permease n=1 Tax=Paludibacterium purpuratum TaxID=1144873 RepID=A0A4R7BBZ9_9NEIS|nr:DMT family transporter [Paludibacterium purpuratum]TDR81425.1 drug/metabolite transporter (DMT)-like permease [Paludibacterium purpuratum]
MGLPVPYLAILTAMFLWSSTFVVLKLVFAVFDPMVVLFARMLVASLCLGLLIWLRGGVRCDYREGDWKWLLLMGLIEPCLYFLFEANALRYTSASQAGMITSAMPFLASLGAMLFLHEKLGLHKWLGMLVSCAGIVWLTWSGHPDSHAPNPLLGNLLELAAMCCSAAFVLIVKKLSDRYSPLLMTGMPALMGCLWFGAGLLLPGVQLPHAFPLMPSLLILYLGAGVTLGAYGLHIWAVTRVPVSVAASFNNLIPVMTVLSAWAVLGETLSPMQMVACLLVLAGVLVGQRR